ncbi:diaminopimelate decarboxylase [Candidatus Marithrix sp. Canyon 246]|uniref:diaminopimelate decarboxylase n=1 Tax=Candidatus Marithrix sp. Canyon 246 TaxID=1827136 RepID=UPI00084A2128|nr:diaminopimelate decarboxylase [Candidatus Marithrix sp. Canyon 246]
MDYFDYRDACLYAENVDLSSIAETYGTPCYVYSRATLERHWQVFDNSLKNYRHLVCYAVKANSNLAILNILARLGSGFDIVSGGELERVLRAGGKAEKIVFSGIGKTKAEISRALDVGIRCFNVESEAELYRINEIAANMGKSAPISFRVNPDVDAHTHPYISTGLKENKFGIAIDDAINIFTKAASLDNVQITGIDCHIGSQLTETEPFVDALKRVLILIEKLSIQGIKLQHIDLGGGLGVVYDDETPPKPNEYVEALTQVLGDDFPYEILIEPGRAIAANAGILLTQVEYLKNTADKNFAIVDAGMNDLIRPALYSAWQQIVPVKPREDEPVQNYDIVGPICETGDFLGKNRDLALKEGDLLAIRSSGAYGFVMSSNYNSRPRIPEIMVDKDRVILIRRRETIDDLLAFENIFNN